MDVIAKRSTGANMSINLEAMVRIMDSVGRRGWMGRGAEGEPADHGLELIGGGGGDAVQASKFLLSAAR